MLYGEPARIVRLAYEAGVFGPIEEPAAITVNLFWRCNDPGQPDDVRAARKAAAVAAVNALLNGEWVVREDGHFGVYFNTADRGYEFNIEGFALETKMEEKSCVG